MLPLWCPCNTPVVGAARRRLNTSFTVNNPMQTAPEQDQLQVRHLRSRDAVHEAFRGFGIEMGAAPPALEAIVVHAADGPFCAVGLTWSRVPIGIPRVEASTLSLAPVLIARNLEPGEPEHQSVRKAIHLALREIFFGTKNWHVIRLNVSARQEEILDVAWRYAINLGYACMITQDPPPHRLDTGELRERAPTLAIYSPRLKGNLARVAAGGVGGAVRNTLKEQQQAITRTIRKLRPSHREVGSRFFVLDLATVSIDDIPDEITFAQIPEDVIIRDPLRYGTSVRRVEQSLRRGDRCFATFIDGELVHHKWASVDPDFMRSMLPAGSRRRVTAYMFDSYTYPPFRGRGLQSISTRFLATQYRREGIEQFANRISSYNTASIRGSLKTRYTEVAEE